MVGTKAASATEASIFVASTARTASGAARPPGPTVAAASAPASFVAEFKGSVSARGSASDNGDAAWPGESSARWGTGSLMGLGHDTPPTRSVGSRHRPPDRSSWLTGGQPMFLESRDGTQLRTILLHHQSLVK